MDTKKVEKHCYEVWREIEYQKWQGLLMKNMPKKPWKPGLLC